MQVGPSLEALAFLALASLRRGGGPFTAPRSVSANPQQQHASAGLSGCTHAWPPATHGCWLFRATHVLACLWLPVLPSYVHRICPTKQVGLDEAASQLRGHPDCIDGDPATTENRIIVLTGGGGLCLPAFTCMAVSAPSELTCGQHELREFGLLGAQPHRTRPWRFGTRRTEAPLHLNLLPCRCGDQLRRHHGGGPAGSAQGRSRRPLLHHHRG